MIDEKLADFSTIDKNQDGAVSLDELKAAYDQ
jgi:hypothetical protein